MKLIWLDLETTGLDPETDRILEIAVSEADFTSPWDARPIYHKVFSISPHQKLDPVVREMHTKNGLLEECYALPCDNIGDCIEADIALCKLVAPWHADGLVLAGSSVHFDNTFLQRYMDFAALLSHRHYDVTAVKLFCQSLGMEKFPKGEAHRAREDVLESIDHAVKCATWLGER